MRNYENALLLSSYELEARSLDVFQSIILKGLGDLEVIIDDHDPGPDGDALAGYSVPYWHRRAA